jgi:hypothetical protein
MQKEIATLGSDADGYKTDYVLLLKIVKQILYILPKLIPEKPIKRGNK